jgi:hypothetical protein
MDREPIDVICAGEDLLDKARGVARQIEERVRRVMNAHGPPEPDVSPRRERTRRPPRRDAPPRPRRSPP